MNKVGVGNGSGGETSLRLVDVPLCWVTVDYSLGMFREEWRKSFPEK